MNNVLKLHIYQLPGEPDFGHSTPIAHVVGGNRAPQTIGPFTQGTVVLMRTRGANSGTGVVLGDVVSAIA